MKKKRIVAIILCLLGLGIPSSVYAYNAYNHNKFYTSGQANLKGEKFDEAISSLEKALEYNDKKSPEISKEIENINKLKTSKAIFLDGEKQMKDKKYLEAINTFQKVIREDTSRYDLAQKNLEECKKLYIDDNIEKAKKEARSKKYEEAIKYLELVIKIDSKYEEALKLKHEYNKAIQKQKEDEEKAKKAAEEVQEAELKKAEANKNNGSGNQNISSSSNHKESVVIGDGGMTIYKENGEWAAYSLEITSSPFRSNMEFKVNRLGSIPDCDYKAVVQNDGKEEIYKGNTSKKTYTYVSISDGYQNKIVPIDVYITYKGKEYKFSKKYSLR